MKHTRIKPIGKKGKQDRAEMKKIEPELQAVSQGRCVHCGRKPDWRGLQNHHDEHKSQGGENTKENVEKWCAPCHFGEDGHRTEGVKVDARRDRTNDFFFGRPKSEIMRQER